MLRLGVRRVLTPGVLRGGVSLVNYALGGLYMIMLGRFAPPSVVNPVAYLLGVFTFLTMFSSPSIASYVTCSLAILYINIALITAAAIILHPAYWPITLAMQVAFVYLYMLFTRRVEYPRWLAGREVSWSLAMVPYAVGARVIQIALGALALGNPFMWVLSLTVPPPIGQLLNNLAFKGRPMCNGRGSWVDGLKLNVTYHAPFIPLNIIYLIMPGQSASLFVNLTIPQLIMITIQVDKLWNRHVGVFRYVAVPASVVVPYVLELVNVINPAYASTIPIALALSFTSALLSMLVRFRVS